MDEPADITFSEGGGVTVNDNALTVDENHDGRLATFRADDPESTPGLTYQWALEGTDRSHFVITAAGVLSFVGIPDFEDPAGGTNVYDITVQATDSAPTPLTGRIAVTVTVRDVDEPADISFVASGGVTVNDNALTVDENHDGTLATFSARDPESKAGLTYEWSVDMTDHFAINAVGVLSFVGIPDFEDPAGGTNVYDITVSALDSDGETGRIAVTVTVEDVDEPADISFVASGGVTVNDNALTVDENHDGTLATFSARDPESKAGLTYEWSVDMTDHFAINAVGVLSFVGIPDFEDPAGGTNVYDITVSALDSDGETGRIAVTVTVEDVDEPADISFVASGGVTVNDNALTVDENYDGTLATFTASDPENAVGLTYVWGLEGTRRTAFEISEIGGDRVLSFVSIPDYDLLGAGNNVYNIAVTALDSDGKKGRIALTVTVEGVDEPPTITGDAARSIEEGGATLVGTYGATDPESATIAWQPLAGSDADEFEFTSSNGRLAFKEAPDFEDADRGGDNEYSVTLGVSAGSHTITFDVVVTVTNKEEQGTLLLSSPQPQVEAAFTATLTDPDIVGATTWKWERSMSSGGGWQPIDGATAASYTPVVGDIDYYLHATATYTDGYSANKSLSAVSANRVEAKPLVNTAPEFPPGPTTRSVPEDARANDIVGAPVVAADAEHAGQLTYTLTGGSDLFTIDGGSGQIRVAADESLDHETALSHSVVVTATDPALAFDTVQVTIDVTNVNEPPNAVRDSAFTREDTAVIIRVLDNDNDPEGEQSELLLTVVTPPPNGSATVNEPAHVGEDRTITYEPNANYHGADSFTYQVTDSGGLSSTARVTVQIAAVNDAPEFPPGPTTRSVPEDARANDIVGAPVVAADAEHAGQLTYTLTGGSDLFTIDGGSGQIRVAADESLDRETAPSHSVVVTATDPSLAFDTVQVTIDVTNVNEPPNAVGDSAFTDEDTAVIIRVLDNDSDPEDERSELLLTVVTPPSNGSATVNEPAGQNRTITYEPNDNYHGADSFTYQVTDSGGLSSTARVTVQIDAVNDAPEFPLSETGARSVPEDAEAGDNVGPPVTATDVEGDTLSYYLSGADASSFVIDSNGQITVAAGVTFNMAMKPTYTVTVTAADEAGATASIDVTITVTTGPVIPPNNAPTFASPAAARSVPEDATGGALVDARVTATDIDAGDILTYRLSGADASSFVIDSNGQITVAAGVTFNMAMKPTYTVTVTAADEAGATASIDVTITVTDAIDNLSPPMVTGSETVTVAENSTAVATYAAQDPDGLASTFTWSLGGTDAGAFEISNTGVLTFDPAPNFEEPADTGTANVDNIYEVTVQADDGGMTGELEVLVTVADVDEPPEIIGDASVTIAENSGTFIESYFTSDPEGSITSWETLAGPDERYFAFDNGALSFVDTPDYEARASNVYQVTVRAVDETSNVGELTVTVTLTNVNEAPAISGLATINVDEGHTGTLGMYGTDDPELSLTNWGFIGDNSALSGPHADRFRFDKETGRLTFAAPPDFEGVGAQGGGGQYEVTVDANDGELHGMLEVTVNVADVEEPGTLTFDRRRPVVGQLTTETLTEPDGVVGAVTWTWQRSTSASGGGTEIATATSRSYTPVTDDVGHYLTATATYEDGYGLGEMLQAVTEFTTAAANSMNAAPMLPDSVVAIELPENARPGSNVGSPVQATDTDGDPISYSLSGDSEFVIDQGTGQIKVAPDAVFDFDAGRRNYSVTVTADDGFGASDTVGVTITITNVDEPPVAADDAPLGFDEDTAATIDVLANDSDPEDAKSALTVSVVRGPARGVVVNPAATPRPTITYTPQANYNGSDSFSYRVTDSDGLTSNVATVALTIYALNDAPEFPPSTAARSVPEDATGDALVGAPVTATDSDLEDTLTYSLSGADASSFVVDSNGQITVAAGVTFDIGTKPTYTVTVTATDNATQPLTATVEVTITVTDDENVLVPVTVMFGASTYPVAEGATVEVTVTLSADPERTVVIPLTATDQNGASPADYSVPGSVTFNAGDTSKSFTFTATQDAINDDGERVLLAFGPSLPAGVSVGTTVTTTVSIEDDDGAGVSVSAAALTIGEGSAGTYTIVLDSEPTADVIVTINDPSGNTDVTADPASLTFSSSDWSSTKTVTVNAVQDADAADETATVTHTVTSTDSSYSGAAANSVVVTVTDDDDPQVTVMFGASTYTVAEGDTVMVTVMLSADPERTVVIPLTATDQNGASPADYSGVPANLTFNAGDVEVVHVHGGDRHGRRRRREGAARLRHEPAGRGERGDDGHDHGEHRRRRSLGLRSRADHRRGQLRHVHHRAAQSAHRRCDRHDQRPIRQHGRDRGPGQPDVLLERLELAEDGDGERRAGRRRGRRDGHRDPHRGLHRQQLQRRHGRQRGRHRHRRRERAGAGDGDVRGEHVHGRGGRYGRADGDAERGP